jgi:low temperature requirement protein LtrA
MTGRGRTTVVRRDGEQVTPLELFFDLVLVLAITQCSTLMESERPWEGLLHGLMALAVLWWAWVGYAWLTSVVDPEEGLVRLVIFVAMASLLVVTLCVPEAFGGLALAFAVAYGVVRAAHIALFTLASRDDALLRRSVGGLAVSTSIAVGLLLLAAFVDGPTRAACWLAAIALDVGGPFVFGSNGWRLVPGHFAERHGLIVIIALGESIVAIGVASEVGLTAGVVAGAVLGVFLAATLWWVYFDVTAIAAGRRLAGTGAGQVQNAMARDAYSYLHFPMVAGIVLASFGLRATIAHETDPLPATAALALCGGVGLYMLGHAAFRWRMTHTVARERLGVGVLLVALTVPARWVPAWVALLAVFVVMATIVTFETTAWSDTRDRIRHRPDDPPPTGETT